MTVLIFISLAISSFVMVLIVPLNITVLYTILRNANFHSKFHAIIFNISVSDLIIALILCPITLYLNIQKLRNLQAENLIGILSQYGIVLLTKVYLLNVILLAADRVTSLRHPQYYRKIKFVYILVAVGSSWIISFLTSTFFFYTDYKKYLSTMLICLISATIIIKLMAISCYQFKLHKSRARLFSVLLQKEQIANQSLYKQQFDPDFTSHKMEKRAANTYLCITLSFAIIYVPILGTCVYLHTCKQGSIEARIAQRVIYWLIMISCIVKVFSLLTRLTALRKACINQFQSHRAIEKRWRAESMCQSRPLQEIDNVANENAV